MSNATSDTSRRLRSTLVVALGVVTMAGLTACDGDGEGGGTSSDTASMSGQASGLPSARQSGGAMMEMKRLNKQLNSIRQQAMQDSSLQRQAQELQTMIDAAIREMSPQAGQQLDRMDSIRGQLQTAQSQGDTAQLRSLIMEAQKLNRALQKLRQRAMQQDEIAQAIKEFRKDLEARMREVNPQADSLMDRADSLRTEMQSQAQGMMGGGASDTAGG